MTRLQIILAATWFLLMAFAWTFYFWNDLRRWWRERVPRRILAERAAREREAELARLREELAAKYLPPGVGTAPPAADR